MNTVGMYWEDYDGQSTDGFTTIGYVSRRGEEIFLPIAESIDTQIAEIKRQNGMRTNIKVYRPQ